MSPAEKGLKAWHAIADNGMKPDQLATILHDDAVFHSPVVHTPQRGKPIVLAYLTAAGMTLGQDGCSYLREVASGDTVVLEFQSEKEGIHVNGIDMITFDEDGMITDFKVMVRPLKAVNKVWEMMGKQLEAMKG